MGQFAGLFQMSRLATSFAVKLNWTFAYPLGGMEQDGCPVLARPNGFVESPIKEMHALAIGQYLLIDPAALWSTTRSPDLTALYGNQYV